MAFDTATEIVHAIRSGQTSAVEVCHDALDRIRRDDEALHAFLEVTADTALNRAAALDTARDEWDRLPLLGVPVAIKDNICTQQIPTTAGSKILSGYRPPYNATAVDRLIAAGAVIVGKTNCDEFAMGSSTENSAYGVSAKPVGARSDAGRIERRLGGGCRRAHASASARVGNWWLGSAAGVALRRRRRQAHVWTSLALRTPGVRVVTRSNRARSPPPSRTQRRSSKRSPDLTRVIRPRRTCRCRTTRKP